MILLGIYPKGYANLFFEGKVSLNQLITSKIAC
jgi:hypothetical protein